ncbi:putative gustatory receptor 36c [Drosophila kikkawai]|uniref:Gustatory receptor n=1 Tax=Drosophila kikkawai TaxID=30033 RepID=A0A6P4ISB4_DROKI|nr:putative gustatory receptor 36c [Drosophila kikkawai]
MVHWVHLLLKSSYFYGLVIGVSNFEFDWRTGRIFTTARSTLYAIVNNGIIVLLLVVYMHGGSDFAARLFKANKLNEYVVIIMTGLRIAAGALTVFSRWSQRCELKKLVRNVISLVQAKPQLLQMSRWGILIKIFTGSVTDLLHMAITFDQISVVESRLFVGLCLQFWMAALLNLALSQHFLVLLLARAQYNMVNTELRQVIDESRHLSNHRPRNGTLMSRCCHLADKLEDMGKVQSKLQAIISQLGEIFAFQGIMVYAGYYITSVGGCYLTYSIITNGIEKIGLTQTNIILSFIWCFFYYLDAIINLFIVLNVQDDHKKMMRLLEERTLFASGLDVRLEETFESLQLQLIRNPLKMEVMKLFSVTRSMTTAMCGSLITHSIFLIQYDMEYF